MTTSAWLLYSSIGEERKGNQCVPVSWEPVQSSKLQPTLSVSCRVKPGVTWMFSLGSMKWRSAAYHLGATVSVQLTSQLLEWTRYPPSLPSVSRTQHTPCLALRIVILFFAELDRVHLLYPPWELRILNPKLIISKVLLKWIDNIFTYFSKKTFTSIIFLHRCSNKCALLLLLICCKFIAELINLILFIFNIYSFADVPFFC